MPYVYIIQSQLDLSFYTGKTFDLHKRLIWHNSKKLNKGVTKNKIPWNYFYTLETKNIIVAGKIENHIKQMKSRKYIQNLQKYPELGEKLLRKYS